MFDELPKHEPILQWAKIHSDSLLNYPWGYYSDYLNSRGWNTKYRNHSQFNGKKPTWRKHRKIEKQFKGVQQSLIPKNIIYFLQRNPFD